MSRFLQTTRSLQTIFNGLCLCSILLLHFWICWTVFISSRRYATLYVTLSVQFDCAVITRPLNVMQMMKIEKSCTCNSEKNGLSLWQQSLFYHIKFEWVVGGGNSKH